MTSEIRANTLKNRVGLGTISFTNTGPVVSGIVTISNSTAAGVTLEDNAGVGGSLKITTPTGYVSIGSGNATFVHLNTDRGIFYFNKRISVDEGIISSYDEDLILQSPMNTNRVTINKTTGLVSIVNDLDVDGHTNLDNVSIAGVTTTSRLDINSTTPIIDFLESDGNPDYRIYTEGGTFVIRDQSSVANRLVINSTGVSVPNDLDVDGHTNLDNVSIAGVTTFSGNVTLAEKIIHDGDPDTYLQFTTNTINLHAGGTTGLTVLDASVRVPTKLGINGAAPQTPLDVIANGSGYAMAIRGRSSDNIADIRFTSNDYGTLYSVLQTGATYLNIQVGSVTNALRITSGGNLYVGQTSGPEQLGVDGGSNSQTFSTNSTNSNGNMLQVKCSGTAKLFLGSSGSFITGNSGVTNQGIRAEGALQIAAGGHSERLRIDSSGRVLIATTSGTQGQVSIFNATDFSTASISNTSDNIFLISDATSGDGVYGASIGFSRVQYPDRRAAAIVTVQEGSDEDNVGLAFFTHPAANATDPVVEKLRISPEGYVTKPAHPSFCARHQGSDGFSGDVVVLTRISTSWDVWNTGGHYSTSTGKFTVPVDGVYYFEGQLMTTGHSNGANIQDMLQLYSNNGRISYCRQRESYFSNTTNANGYYTNSVGGSARLSAGNTVWLQRQSGQGWSYSNRYYSYFTGWLIG